MTQLTEEPSIEEAVSDESVERAFNLMVRLQDALSPSFLTNISISTEDRLGSPARPLPFDSFPGWIGRR